MGEVKEWLICKKKKKMPVKIYILKTVAECAASSEMSNTSSMTVICNGDHCQTKPIMISMN